MAGEDPSDALILGEHIYFKNSASRRPGNHTRLRYPDSQQAFFKGLAQNLTCTGSPNRIIDSFVRALVQMSHNRSIMLFMSIIKIPTASTA